MAYTKGCVSITSGDIALLRHVRNARFISHSQLFELLRQDSQVFWRQTFYWRTLRLLKSRHIERMEGRSFPPVYVITQLGLLELESRGEFLMTINSETPRRRAPALMFHSLELNAVRLALANKGLLAAWESDLEISSRNMVAGSYAKDYDAVVKLSHNGQLIEFALEYERTYKSTKDYAKIRQALESEQNIRRVLYLTSHPHLLLALLDRLAPTSRRIGLTTARAFREQLLSASVTLPGDERTMMTCEEFLQ
jgi:hypothetical protein